MVRVSRQNPFEPPTPRGSRVFQLLLRSVVVVLLIGVALESLHFGKPYPLIDSIWRPTPDGQATSTFPAFVASILLLGIAASTFVRPINVLLVCAGLFLFFNSFIELKNSRENWRLWHFIFDATRWVAPISLMLIDFWPPSRRSTLAMTLAGVGTLRIAAVATFFAHGVLALMQCQFGGPLIESLGIPLSPALAWMTTWIGLDSELGHFTLGVIAALDFIVATSLLSSPSEVFAISATVWGAILALSPVFHQGFAGYAMTLSSVTLLGAPALVALFHIFCAKYPPPNYLAEKTNHHYSADH